MNDDEVIRQRVSGSSTRAIAKAQATTVAEVNKAIDRFAETTIDANVRKHTLALELARLDELQEVFYARALEGDVQCGALVTKIIDRRCVILGLSLQQPQMLQIVDATPKETSTDRIERVFAELAAMKTDPPATDEDDPASAH